MKRNPSSRGPITQPLLKDLMDRMKEQSKQTTPEATVSSDPVEPADLYQDAGGGYNPEFTFPQE